MLKLCISLAFLCNLCPFGKGAASNVDERTQNSFEGSITRILLLFVLFFCSLSTVNINRDLKYKNDPVMTSGWIADQFKEYCFLFIIVRMFRTATNGIAYQDQLHEFEGIHRDQNENIDNSNGMRDLTSETLRKILAS